MHASRDPIAPIDGRPSALGSGGRAAILIIAAVALAYAGSYQGPFVFDDLASIAANPSIRHLATALSPPGGGFTVSGRPILNLSFAMNYAISGTQVWSYHGVNALIHVLAALTLFGVLRRAAGSARFACVVALLWAVHPLQTESVTYVVQRAESLMGLFYLLTLYGFIRATEAQGSLAMEDAASPFAARVQESPGLRRRDEPWSAFAWASLSVAACFLGMATKEVMVTAPCVVLLYDRTFVSGSFSAALSRRWGYYAGLAASWVLLGVLVAGSGGRGGTAGFDSGIAWWDYAITQFRAIPHYLWLSVWPRSLVFDYGAILEARPSAVAVNAVGVVLLAAASIAGFLRRSSFGFLGVCFFLILLPSSSVIPVPTETIAEHRMYLPLAAVLAAGVGGAGLLARRFRPRQGTLTGAETRIAAGLFLLAALGLGFRTHERNSVYASARTLWTDSVNAWPANARAHNNLGMVLFEAGDLAGAERQFRATLDLHPDFARAESNLGRVLAALGHWSEAAEHYRRALRYLSGEPALHEDLGAACLRLGQFSQAGEQYSEALRLNPDSANAHFFLAVVLDRSGQLAAAESHYRDSVRLEPENWQAWYNLGTLLARSGRYAEAAAGYARAVVLRPDFVDVHVNYGNVLAAMGRTLEAADEFRAALGIEPSAADARAGLARLGAMPLQR